MNSHRSRSGFTIIEILVVIAISLILFGLLIRPLIDALRYSKQAQLKAAAQDSGRKVVEALSRELGSAAYVFDGSSETFAGNTAGSNPINYANFLDLSIPKEDPATGKILGYTIGQAFNAKLDFVMARRQSSTLLDPTSGRLTDPNTGLAVPSSQESIDIQATNGVAHLVPTNIQTPIAPGTTMVRYFIGLLDPTQPYENDRDHIFGNNTKANTYVLLRAQFSPYTIVSGQITPNSSLFALDSNNKPVLDDPDFYRMVSPGDINWLDPAHGIYGALGAQQHNTRVKYWMEIAKPVITAPEIDLLILPHNTDKTLAIDVAGQRFPGVAHYGFTHDPVAGATPNVVAGAGFDQNSWPVVHTSVVFRPSTFTTDAAPVTNLDYGSAGVPQSAQTAATGLPYIPTVYQTVGQSWTTPFTITIYPAFSAPSPSSQPFYSVTQATTNDVNGNFVAGDLVESVLTNSGATPIAVYNVTQHKAITPSSALPTNMPQYVPINVNADAGTVNFDVPALTDTTNAFSTHWSATVPTSGTVTLGSLTGTSTNPLAPGGSGGIYYAQVVPGSIRVYGPDMESGPDNTPPTGYTSSTTQVLYTPVGQSANSTTLTNQYQVDYSTGILTFGQNMAGQNLTITFDYQANVSPQSNTPSGYPAISPTNPAQPMIVKVDYHSRDNLFAQVGIRYFDADNNVQIVNLNSQIKVGNNNR